MTVPWPGPPPAAEPVPPAAAAAPWFVVRTDRQLLNRRYRLILGTQAVFAVALVVVVGVLAVSFGIGALEVLPLFVLLLGQVVTVGFTSYTWGARVAVAEPMTLGPPGLSLHSPQGRVFLPWAGVESLRLRRLRQGQVLRIRVRAEASGPAARGPHVPIRSELSPRNLERLHRQGFLVGSVGLTEDLGRVVDVAQRLAGRPLLIP